MAKMTVRGLDALKPKAKSYKVTVDRDLYLRVATDGTKTWLVRYSVHGKQRQARLPRTYSSNNDPAYMSLAQALAENARIQAMARDGLDFQEEQERLRQLREQQAAQEEASKATFRQMFEQWISEGVSRKDDNAELKRTFNKDLLPSLGDVQVRMLTDGQFRDALRQVGRVRGRGRTAERMLTELRQLFRWAIKRQPWRSLFEAGNPVDLLETKQVVSPDYLATIRERVLRPTELHELLEKFRQMQADYDAAPNKRVATRPLRQESQLALWISLGTACRIGELLKARWDHVDLKKGTWFVPKENTKTKVDWLVFLSPFALAKFKALRMLTSYSDWCFPSRDGESHICLKTVSKQVGDRQIRFKKRKALAGRRNDDSLVLADGANGEWTPHDLRRTAATMMQALGVAPDVIDRCQNHVLPGSKVRRHYLHHDYAEEKQQAWNALGTQLERILGSDEPDLLTISAVEAKASMRRIAKRFELGESSDSDLRVGRSVVSA
ncbi:tyrosine-type recombinase/integrase [Pseudomonas monteilii]|jgi:integrase|uniref:tyrosine-type recombinase/integrase n=1 Tax=Pseudomonadota TaxID=1224 RepID=UPI001E2CDB65|nr:site-specific integrase [Pseudomonas monteilii]MCE0872575.1 tyrosine-type recombinase/integrase [Pseudomonas monteilii]